MQASTRHLLGILIGIIVFAFISYFVWWAAESSGGICTNRYSFPRGDCIRSVPIDDPRFWVTFWKRTVLLGGVFIFGAIYHFFKFLIELRKERSAGHEE
jgi:hypothetical protein